VRRAFTTQLRALVRPWARPLRDWFKRRTNRDAVREVRRLTPASRRHGWDRGGPIDRYYIEHFLRRHAGEGEYGVGDIRGRVLEIADDRYTRKFGSFASGRSARPGDVTSSDVLDQGDANTRATIIGDLTREEDLPQDAFDCVICTQVLLIIFDFRAALRSLHRTLRPGGVLLMTNPGISRICRPDVDLWGDYWRFTSLSIRRLLEELFPAENVKVEAYGNVRSAAAALYGLSAKELSAEERDLHDPDYEVTVAARAVKPG
jgi:SAM-dependent methyltransferase